MKCPFSFDESLQMWVPRLHADVTAIVRDSGLWSSEFGPGPVHLPPEQKFPLVSADPPEHTRQRRLVGRAFLPSAVNALAPRIEELVDRLLDDLSDKGEADIMEEFALPVPLTVICWLLGTSPDDYQELRPWAYTMAEALWSNDPADAPRLMAAFQAAGGYVAQILGGRRQAAAAGETLPDDLITRLMEAEPDGTGLTDQEILFIVTPLISAGSITTTYLIGNLLYRLVERPERLEMLRDDPSLMGAAIEESLRLDPPIRGFARTNTAPTSLHGVDLEPNTKVVASFEHANRDPAVFDRPDEFDMTRSTQQLRQHYAFGGGIHVCLGAPLARLEAEIAVGRLITRLPDLKLAGEPTPTRIRVLNGWDHLPVAWVPTRVAR